MGFLSFLKSTNPKPKKEEKKRYEPMPKPEPAKTFVLEAIAVEPAGNMVKLPYYTTLTDGTCLIAENGKYYHTFIGCGANALHWKLVTIEEAEKAGYMPCLMCEDEKRKNRMFDIGE